ncbi:hypothetical protein U1872_18260 [Sphingomonas sp. RB3P16]|uniref:hypothetical protein n=1 Tax=Parasphingomonas frigoris TaxID=3096163 RepID=UPI002FCA8E95
MTEWILAGELRRQLLAVHGAEYEPRLQRAVYQRATNGMLGFSVERATCNGAICQMVPLEVWSWITYSDWALGDFSAGVHREFPDGAILKALRNNSPLSLPIDHYNLFRVSFDLEGCRAMGIAQNVSPPPPIAKARGPKGKYDWPAAMAALLSHDEMNDVIGPVVMGKAPQSTLEQFVASWFSDRGLEPSESLVRTHVEGTVQHRREEEANKRP